MAAAIPLCVDLDGSLTPVDTLHESLLCICRRWPQYLFALPLWLTRGKAGFKQAIADRADFDASLLPIRQELLAWLTAERDGGRRLVLVTAANRKIASDVAARLGIFDEVIASDASQNLSGNEKRNALVRRFGEKGFDYVGNDIRDEPVWRSCRNAIVVGAGRLVDRASRVSEVVKVFTPERQSLRVWIKAIRLHQWVKNALIFLPAMLAHAILQPAVLAASIRAFVAFGLCASSVYLINDMFDLAADRQHPRKKHRPFASGQLTVYSGLVAATLLLLSAAAIALTINLLFCAVLAGYYVLTWAYSLQLKRMAVVDVMTLAALYTSRIIAGSAATMIRPSFWLLAFSVFIFLSLSFVKRYTELYDSSQAAATGDYGRGYSPADLGLIMSLGTASGYCTVVVLALYINSAESVALYHHASGLWLTCPLMLFWISRLWLLTTRGRMHDDPVIFALRDRVSFIVIGLIAAIVFLAI